MTDIDPSLIVSALTLIVTVTMQVVAFSRMIGQISTRLDVHDEQHIRHQTRIDEHAKLINQHERDLAVLQDRHSRVKV